MSTSRSPTTIRTTPRWPRSRPARHGFDIVVPSANFMPIWIEDGLLLESRPDQMENFKHVDPRWVDVEVRSRAATTPCRGSGA